ncbi:hypothetical protein FDA95_03180 [Clostridium botulinum]|nr:hypothetical protein [Clostridium botulinum]
MNYYKNIRDCNGNIILHGMFLTDTHCQYLTYQVRLRNDNFVLHTGSSYSLLTPSRARSLKILKNANENILGYGHHLFKSSL